MRKGLSYHGRRNTVNNGASLNFNFVNGQGLDPRITFTRASTATFFNSSGTLTTAAIDAPRLDYNPATLAAQGLLIEEARTNSIRNNTMVGAVSGTPGTLPTTGGNAWFVSAAAGLATNVIGTGVSAGITYIDVQLVGTATGGSYVLEFEPATGVAGSAGQTWTNSFWLSQVGGTTNNITGTSVRIQYRDSASVVLATGSLATATLSGTLTRSQFTSTAPASTAFVRPGIQVTTSAGAADITLRIGLPQLEQGAFATSVIPTTTTALTRSADVASVNTLSPWWNASEGTFYVEGSAGSLANSPIFVMPHDGTSNNYLNSPLLTTAGLARLAGVVGGAAWTNVNTANSTTANTTFKSASAFKAGDQAICLNAGTVGTGVNASLPVVTTVKLGDWRTSGNSINGYLRRIVYYPRRLSNTELQAITV